MGFFKIPSRLMRPRKKRSFGKKTRTTSGKRPPATRNLQSQKRKRKITGRKK